MDEATTRLVAAVTTGLRAAGDPETAEGAKRYLKTDLTHYGVRLPVIRKLVADALRAHGPLARAGLVAATRALWHPEVHESRIAASVLLERRFTLLRAEDTALLEELLRDSRTWALVDLLAGSVAGRLLLREPTVVGVYQGWAAEEEQWIRRSGVLAFLVPLHDETGFDAHWPVFTALADPLLADHRFFVRKALGWVLRQTGRKHPAEVYDWLLPRAGRSSGVTVREAVRYLGDARSESVAAAYRGGAPGRR
ncbi:DNA alkylation repair protein [Streptomyces spiramenti]|uniref:DNA alkylation repair protein n=1 Tax=Streptomyces spiramenti TaxID=2720606 RepID=A0ABX1AL29_9ACTN|nr:DNA alkylation repair protein [Streptomyces spiramenti]NJP67814.1 DNA alkylation repair protein [Streptomyces spiramenti]